MTAPWAYAAVLVAALPALAIGLYTIWVYYHYVPTVVRIFAEKPIFHPPDVPPDPEAEAVRFQTRDGVWLCGSWLAPRGEPERGTIVFCHEYLSDRWSCRPYCDPLRAHGFGVFAFDFGNHGESGSRAGYEPTQWVSSFEVEDLRAAIEHVRGRGVPGERPIALLGVSRGGSAAILAAAADHSVCGVATDGAFPTHRTQLVYMMRWVGIYVRNPRIYRLTPSWYYSLVAWLARQLAARRHGCPFPKVERAIGRISPRPLLMIHGANDGYIVPEIARYLFECAGAPKELWIVPGAKHNAAVHVAGPAYAARLCQFFSSACAASPERSP